MTAEPGTPSSEAVASTQEAAAPTLELAVHLADWVVASGDNRGLPFAIIDKVVAEILIFGADGRLWRAHWSVSPKGTIPRPVLATGESSAIPPKERTTPAGRFVAAFGPALGDKDVLWVDFEQYKNLVDAKAT